MPYRLFLSLQSLFSLPPSTRLRDIVTVARLAACCLLAFFFPVHPGVPHSPRARHLPVSVLQCTIMKQRVCYLLSAACCMYVRSAATDASQSVACFQA
jgi:hypothetical protein